MKSQKLRSAVQCVAAGVSALAVATSRGEVAAVRLSGVAAVCGLGVVTLDGVLDAVHVLSARLLPLAQGMAQGWRNFRDLTDSVLEDSAVLVSAGLQLQDNLIPVFEEVSVLVVLSLQDKVEIVTWGLGVAIESLMSGACEGLLEV